MLGIPPVRPSRPVASPRKHQVEPLTEASASKATLLEDFAFAPPTSKKFPQDLEEVLEALKAGEGTSSGLLVDEYL